jgi:hypothetical protein
MGHLQYPAISGDPHMDIAGDLEPIGNDLRLGQLQVLRRIASVGELGRAQRGWDERGNDQ